jgi:hypothetical protein
VVKSLLLVDDDCGGVVMLPFFSLSLSLSVGVRGTPKKCFRAWAKRDDLQRLVFRVSENLGIFPKKKSGKKLHSEARAFTLPLEGKKKEKRTAQTRLRDDDGVVIFDQNDFADDFVVFSKRKRNRRESFSSASAFSFLSSRSFSPTTAYLQ